MEYRKGLFWDHFYLLFLLMTSIYEISKFADDIKIPSWVNTLTRVFKIIAKDWTNKWEIKFNVNKYRVMHIGKRDLESQY